MTRDWWWKRRPKYATGGVMSQSFAYEPTGCTYPALLIEQAKQLGLTVSQASVLAGSYFTIRDSGDHVWTDSEETR